AAHAVVDDREGAVVEEAVALADGDHLAVEEAGDPAVVRADPQRPALVLVERTDRLARKAVSRLPRRDAVAVDPAQAAVAADPDPAVPLREKRGDALAGETIRRSEPRHGSARRDARDAAVHPDPDRAAAVARDVRDRAEAGEGLDAIVEPHALEISTVG